MVKKLVTIALGLALAFGATAQLGNNAGHKQPVRGKDVSFEASDVQFWVGTGSNSAVVVIGWDDNPNGNFALAWGVRWNGSTTALALVDSIATYDVRLTYSFSGSMMQSIQYSDDDLVSSSSYGGWCYMLNGSWAPNAYNNQPVADGDLMEVSSSCAFSLTTATAATDPNAGTSCPKAQAVSVTGITTYSATVNITDTDYVNNYTVMLYAGDSLVDSSVIFTQTIVYTNLTDNTGYTVKVFSNCLDGTQTSSRDASFRTPCLAVANADLPWTEDFQSGTGSSYATAASYFSNHIFCWDLINPYSTSDPYINNSSSVNVSGGKCLYVSSRPSTPTILVLPPFESTPDQLRLQFDVLSTYRHGFDVGVITDITDITTFTPIATCLPDGNGWTHHEVTFAGVTSGRLAFRNNDSGPAYLDNVTVDEVPSCVKPSQVLVSTITASSATLTITDPNSTNHYMVYADGDSVEINASTYTINNLQPNTRYEVGVKTLCSDTTTGVTTTSFRTACGPIAVPYHEDFSQFVDFANGYGYAVADSTLPCWAFLKGRHFDRLELFTPSQSSTYAYGTDGYTLRIYGNNSDSRDILVLPELDQEINTLEISFMARPSETGNFGGSLQVGYITDAADSSTFVAVANYPCARFTNGYDICAAVFPDAPDEARIALRYLPSGGSAKSWYIDDIDVHEMPACVRAQGISVDNIGTESFRLHVIDPMNEGSYRCYYTANAVTDSVDFNDTVYVIDGLAAATDYTVSVVTICGDGTLTLPHTTTVSTPCATIVLDGNNVFLETFDSIINTGSGIFPACWTSAHIAGTSNKLWASYSASASSCHSGTRMMQLPDMQSGNITLLVPPAFSIATANQYHVSLWVKRTNNYTNKVNEGVKVWANSTPDTVGGTMLFHARRSITQQPAVSSEGWYEYTGVIPLTGTVYIVMEGISEYGAATYIDDFSVQRAPSCDEPADLAYDPATGIVSWTAGNATEWQVRDGETLTIVNTPTYSNPLWQSATVYTVDVRSICGVGDTNDWRNSLTFTTPRAACPDTMPVPYSTTFSGYDYVLSPFYGGAPLPDCWNVYSNGTNRPSEGSDASIYYSGIGISTSMNNYGCVTPNDPYFAFMAYAPYDGTYSNYITNMNQYGTRKFAVLPRFTLPLNNLDLSFDYSMSARNGAELRIGYIVNDTADFTALYVVPTSYRALAHVDRLDFATLADNIPANARMAMLWLTTDTVHTGSAPANFFCGIDNMVVAEAVSCKYPRDFVADSVGFHGFSLAWREVSNTPATQWQVAYGPRGFNPDSEGSLATVDNNHAVVTGLTSDSEYDAYVRSVCGAESYSAWAGPVSIHTVCPDGGNVMLGTEEGNDYTVVFANWGNTVCQSIFTAAELASAGLRAGDTVNNLVYNWHAGTTARFTKAFSIYMTHTAVTAFPETSQATDWLPVADTNLVLSDSLTTTADSLTHYDLTTPFVWNGTDGIAITTFVNQPDGAIQSSTGVYAYSSAADSRRTLFARVDGTAYTLEGLASVAPTSSVYRANILIERPCIDTIADTSGTTPEPPAPVDATIAASDILYWVGEGQNAVVLAVNWADTALAWGYRFATDSVSTETMMTDIAAADPRLSVLGSGMISDINYIDTAAGMTDTLGITTGNWWNSLLNGASDNGMGQMLVNGDFKKWGDPVAGAVVDSVDYGEYGVFYTYVFPMTIHPVTVPDTTGTIPPTPQPEHGPFCGAVGTEGCNAIKADSSAIVAWATGINVVRGPQSIANPDGPVASTGVDSNALGMATLNNSLQVVSLGDGGSATLTFAHPIRNGEGPDFAVYENGFGDSFLELAFVEVSSDGERFVRFPATSLTQTETQTNGTGATDPTFINNLAGKFRIGYGTPFDLAELADSTGIDIDSIVYVRVVDVIGSINPQYGTYDAFGHIINDPWPTDNVSGGFDLSGVAVLYERIDIVPEPPTPVESTIAASDIIYWVGEGANEAIMAVNWADTALAWGYRFDGSKTVADMMEDIATADQRFSYTTDGGMLDDILFVVAEGDTLRKQSPAVFWESKNNSITDAGMNQTLSNGDFEKWAEPAAGVVVDSIYYEGWGWIYINVYNMEIHPVSIPGGIGIHDVTAVVEGIMPNPTTDYVNVVVNHTVEAVLYDLPGRRVAVYTLAEGSNKLDLTALQSGVYMLRTAGAVNKIVKR